MTMTKPQQRPPMMMTTQIANDSCGTFSCACDYCCSIASENFNYQQPSEQSLLVHQFAASDYCYTPPSPPLQLSSDAYAFHDDEYMVAQNCQPYSNHSNQHCPPGAACITSPGLEWYSGPAEPSAHPPAYHQTNEPQQPTNMNNNHNGRSSRTRLHLRYSKMLADEILLDMLKSFGPIRKFIALKDNANIPRGSAFVTFERADSADLAKVTLHGQRIAGAIMYIQEAKFKSTRNAKSELYLPAGSRLFVVCPRSTETSALHEVFSNYGELEHISVLKSQDGGHRGAAFVKYRTASMAAHAMKSVNILRGLGQCEFKACVAVPPSEHAASQFSESAQQAAVRTPSSLSLHPAQQAAVPPRSDTARLIANLMQEHSRVKQHL